MSRDPERGGNTVESSLTEQERLARIDYHYDALKDSLNTAYQPGEFNPQDVFEKVTYLVALDATRDLPSLAGVFKVIGQKIPGLAGVAVQNLLDTTYHSADAAELMLETTKALKLPTDHALTQTIVDTENWLRTQTIDPQVRGRHYNDFTKIPDEPTPAAPTLSEAAADLTGTADAIVERVNAAPQAAEPTPEPTVPDEIKLHFTPEQEEQLRSAVMPLFMRIGQLTNLPNPGQMSERSKRKEIYGIEQQILTYLNLPELPPDINEQLAEQRRLELENTDMDLFVRSEYYEKYYSLLDQAIMARENYEQLFTDNKLEPTITQLCQALVDRELAEMRLNQFQIDEFRKHQIEPELTGYSEPTEPAVAEPAHEPTLADLRAMVDALKRPKNVKPKFEEIDPDELVEPEK